MLLMRYAAAHPARHIKPPATRSVPGGIFSRHSPLTTRHYFNSTDQYAFSRNVFHDWYLVSVSLRLSSGLRFGFSGLRTSVMCACFGVRPPFFTLQLIHAQTIFSQVDCPPWLRGTT